MFIINILINVILTILVIVLILMFSYNKFVPLSIRNDIESVIKTGGSSLTTILTPLISSAGNNIISALGFDQDTLKKIPTLVSKVNSIDTNLLDSLSSSASNINDLYKNIDNLNKEVSSLIYPNSPITQLGSLSPAQVNNLINLSNRTF